MSDSPSVLTEKRGVAFWITINRPDKRNALNASVIAGIRQGYRDAHADPEVRAIVVTGAGEKAFCAGGDLQPGGGFAFDLSRPISNTPTCCAKRGPPLFQRSHASMAHAWPGAWGLRA